MALNLKPAIYTTMMVFPNTSGNPALQEQEEVGSVRGVHHVVCRQDVSRSTAAELDEAMSKAAGIWSTTDRDGIIWYFLQTDALNWDGLNPNRSIVCWTIEGLPA